MKQLKYSDHLSYKYPVSIKGVVLINGQIPLLKNERNEYELPGGKLEIDEQPIDCVSREIAEELNIIVRVANIIDSWLYTITDDVRVVIITYGCELVGNEKDLRVSSEHKELIMVDPNEINSLNMPERYKNSIHTWCAKNAGQEILI
jgi:8-oxo-dGTP pyrophosphatase MutT (NUDIX family)